MFQCGTSLPKLLQFYKAFIGSKLIFHSGSTIVDHSQIVLFSFIRGFLMATIFNFLLQEWSWSCEHQSYHQVISAFKRISVVTNAHLAITHPSICNIVYQMCFIIFVLICCNTKGRFEWALSRPIRVVNTWEGVLILLLASFFSVWLSCYPSKGSPEFIHFEFLLCQLWNRTSDTTFQR